MMDLIDPFRRPLIVDKMKPWLFEAISGVFLGLFIYLAATMVPRDGLVGVAVSFALVGFLYLFVMFKIELWMRLWAMIKMSND